MARQNNRQNNRNNDWIEIRKDVSYRLAARENYFSLNWFGAVIHGCQIVYGENGPFISWPSFKGKNGTWVKTSYVYAPKDSEDDKILKELVADITANK